MLHVMNTWSVIHDLHTCCTWWAPEVLFMICTHVARDEHLVLFMICKHVARDEHLVLFMICTHVARDEHLVLFIICTHVAHDEHLKCYSWFAHMLHVMSTWSAIHYLQTCCTWWAPGVIHDLHTCCTWWAPEVLFMICTHVACDEHLKCYSWFAHMLHVMSTWSVIHDLHTIVPGATWAYTLETVHGPVRRL